MFLFKSGPSPSDWARQTAGALPLKHCVNEILCPWNISSIVGILPAPYFFPTEWAPHYVLRITVSSLMPSLRDSNQFRPIIGRCLSFCNSSFCNFKSTLIILFWIICIWTQSFFHLSKPPVIIFPFVRIRAIRGVFSVTSWLKSIPSDHRSLLIIL